MIPSSELIPACRKSYGNTISASPPTTSAITAGRANARAGDDGQPLLDELAATRKARTAQEEARGR